MGEFQQASSRLAFSLPPLRLRRSLSSWMQTMGAWSCLMSSVSGLPQKDFHSTNGIQRSYSFRWTTKDGALNNTFGPPFGTFADFPFGSLRALNLPGMFV